MKFGEIFRFELAYQARRVWPWLIAVVLIVLCFLMMRDGTMAEALYGGRSWLVSIHHLLDWEEREDDDNIGRVEVVQ